MKTLRYLMQVIAFAALFALLRPEAAGAGERLYLNNFSINLPCGWKVLVDKGGDEVTLALPGKQTAIITVNSYKNVSGLGRNELWRRHKKFLLGRPDCEFVSESMVSINGARWKKLEYVDRYVARGAYGITMFTVDGGYCFKITYSGVGYKAYMDNMPDFQEVSSDIRLFDSYGNM